MLALLRNMPVEHDAVRRTQLPRVGLQLLVPPTAADDVHRQVLDLVAQRGATRRAHARSACVAPTVTARRCAVRPILDPEQARPQRSQPKPSVRAESTTGTGSIPARTTEIRSPSTPSPTNSARDGRDTVTYRRRRCTHGDRRDSIHHPSRDSAGPRPATARGGGGGPKRRSAATPGMRRRGHRSGCQR